MNFPACRVAKLHINVFDVQLEPLTKRILAYWILTYSFPRLLAGVYKNTFLDLSASFTYFVEGSVYHAEYSTYRTANDKSLYVAYMCYVLGVLTLFRDFKAV